MIVLGLHGGFTINQHESAAALIIDGKIVAACEDERYTRIKGSYGRMPTYAIAACLRKAGISMYDVDLVVTPGSTYDGFDESIAAYLKHEFCTAPEIMRVHHQMAHLAIAFYGSGLEDAFCLALDNSGDGACGMVGSASRKNGIQIIQEIPNTNSLGMFYTLMTFYLGYNDGDEYKVMGLAPYGKASIDLNQVLEITKDGWKFNRDMLRTDPPVQSPFEPVYNPQLEKILGRPHRNPADEIGSYHQDIAASTQVQLEEAIFSLIKKLQADGQNYKNLCIAGGVGMNCVANGKLLRSGMFENVFVPPAASDRGLALGCAYLGAVKSGDTPQPILSPGMGEEYGNEVIQKELQGNGIAYKEIEDPSLEAARLIAQDKIVGWHQGRAEYGARSLGFRSILSKPGGSDFKDTVNARIKYRESFRPFAPATTLERAPENFASVGFRSSYMSFTFQANDPQDDRLGAVVHVDGSARLQTVQDAENPLFHKLLTDLGEINGLPVALNTSFNLKGQPIVETPRDALMTFHGCGLDHLILGNFLISKANT